MEYALLYDIDRIQERVMGNDKERKNRGLYQSVL